MISLDRVVYLTCMVIILWMLAVRYEPGDGLPGKNGRVEPSVSPQAHTVVQPAPRRFSLSVKGLKPRLTPRDVIRKTAIQEGIRPEILLAMWRVETSCRLPAPVGDQGRSVGPFQIQYRLHRIPRQKAEEPEYATRWTCRRIKTFRTVWEGVRRHNGGGPASWRYVRRVKELLEKSQENS